MLCVVALVPAALRLKRPDGRADCRAGAFAERLCFRLQHGSDQKVLGLTEARTFVRCGLRSADSRRAAEQLLLQKRGVCLGFEPEARKTTKKNTVLCNIW